MARIRYLRHAPITEAIVDFRIALPDGFRPERLREARDQLADEYPVIVERTGMEAHFEFTGAQPKEPRTRDLGFQGIWLKTEDEKSVGQFRVDGFTFNRLKPYTRWEQILPEALRLWRIYAELVNPQNVTRVALRYINRMTLPTSGPLDDYILTGPKLPPSVSQTLSGFATRVLLEHTDHRMKANVIQVLEPGIGTPSPSLLFDIDVYRADHLEVSVTAMEPLLRDLRDYKNQVFFGSLTERLVEVFE